MSPDGYKAREGDNTTVVTLPITMTGTGRAETELLNVTCVTRADWECRRILPLNFLSLFEQQQWRKFEKLNMDQCRAKLRTPLNETDRKLTERRIDELNERRT